jgi:hypothetical protein
MWMKSQLYPSMTVHVAVYESNRRARLEFNPSRKYTESYDLRPLSDVREILAGLLIELEEYFHPVFTVDYMTGEILSPDQWPTDWEHRITVSRLDVAYDFEAPTGTGWSLDRVHGLAKPLRGIPVIAYLGPNNSPGLRLQYSSSTGTVQLYNKGMQDPTAPSGLMRFEVQARRGMLRPHGAITLDGLSEASAARLLAQRLKFSNFGVEIGAPTAAQEIAATKETALNKVKMMGFWAMRTQGVDLGLDARQYRELDRKMTSHGIHYF